MESIGGVILKRCRAHFLTLLENTKKEQIGPKRSAYDGGPMKKHNFQASADTISHLRR